MGGVENTNLNYTLVWKSCTRGVTGPINPKFAWPKEGVKGIKVFTYCIVWSWSIHNGTLRGDVANRELDKLDHVRGAKTFTHTKLSFNAYLT